LKWFIIWVSEKIVRKETCQMLMILRLILIYIGITHCQILATCHKTNHLTNEGLMIGNLFKKNKITEHRSSNECRTFMSNVDL